MHGKLLKITRPATGEFVGLGILDDDSRNIWVYDF